MPRTPAYGSRRRVAPSGAQLPMLQDRLILNRFLCRLLGADEFKELREALHRTTPGYRDGYSNFYQVIAGLESLNRSLEKERISADQLAIYDLRIKEYADRLNRHRSPSVQLLYFQYLAVLFTEIYLDRLFGDRQGLLGDLNGFVESENLRLAANAPAALGYNRFEDKDLDKIAFWMATGSGKTLIMHINLWQYLHYSKGRREHASILLVTPNEGLSRQHLEELRKSGIEARRHEEAEPTLGGGNERVRVIEITKLTDRKRGGGLSVEVDSFGPNNLLLVDEGHRGASGETWRKLRQAVAERGFTFEYSATFGQIVNGAAANRRGELLEEYSKAILFDYAYRHFYGDGYGKNYWVINVREETESFNKRIMLGNLLSFYEQSLVYESEREPLRPYNIEKPLWVFVGHSVTGGKTKEDDESLTDVQEIVRFFKDFLSDRAEWMGQIEAIFNGTSGVQDVSGRDRFQDLFGYLRDAECTSEEMYDGIVRMVFRGHPGEAVRAVELKSAPGEIALRAGASSPYFGVINIGDVSGLRKRLEEKSGIAVEDENISGSLFDAINAADSKVNALIGSRKFMEGWDSFRVASMGLMNIGKGEGSQIIQLFGRGVRLRGKDLSLKRTSSADGNGAPPHIRLLETLNVFGIRANYMARFREEMQREGIPVDYEDIEVRIRVQEDFLKRGLQMLRPPEGESFQEKRAVALQLDERIKISLDLRPRVEVAASDAEHDTSEGEKLAGTDRAGQLKRLARFLDWDRVYFDTLEFKKAKEWHNLSFTPAVLRKIVEEGSYTLYCPEERLKPPSFAEMRRIGGIAVAVLQKYAAAFYERERRAWEQERLRLTPLSIADRNLDFKAYQVRAKLTFAEKVRELIVKADALQTLDERQYPHIHFDRHLYQPLLVSREDVEASPPGLNEGERQLVADLRSYLQSHEGDFAGKEVFLLRNLTRGKGIGFFEAGDGETFYPDFILWVIEGGKQAIAFLDPHGLQYTRGLEDPKIQLHKVLREMEPQLQAHCPEWEVYLTCFIIAPISYEELRNTARLYRTTEEQFEENHVVFQKDKDYVQKLFRILLGSLVMRRLVQTVAR